MPDLRIHRDHNLGLIQAREVAHAWVLSAQEKLDLTCTYHRGEAVDRIAFTRSGVSGELMVSAQRFELEAQLGFLLGAFKERIEQEVSNNLDQLLAQSSPLPVPPASDA